MPIKKPKAKLQELLLRDAKFDFIKRAVPNKVAITKGATNPVNMYKILIPLLILRVTITDGLRLPVKLNISAKRSKLM